MTQAAKKLLEEFDALQQGDPLFAPCQPGAARRHLGKPSRFQGTSGEDEILGKAVLAA